MIVVDVMDAALHSFRIRRRFLILSQRMQPVQRLSPRFPPATQAEYQALDKDVWSLLLSQAGSRPQQACLQFFWPFAAWERRAQPPVLPDAQYGAPF